MDRQRKLRARKRILFTFAEMIIYIAAVYFGIVLQSSAYVMFPLMLLFPVAVAITFSGGSYTAELFKHKIFSKLGSLSLAIYFTHNSAPLRLVTYFFPGRSYKFSVALIIGFTVISVFVYFLLIKLMKYCVGKIKDFFAEA